MGASSAEKAVPRERRRAVKRAVIFIKEMEAGKWISDEAVLWVKRDG